MWRPDEPAFYRALGRLVERAGSQSECARLTGVRQSKISNWLGGAKPSLFDFAQFCVGLGVSMDAMLAGSVDAEAAIFLAGQIAERRRLAALLELGDATLPDPALAAPSAQPARPESDERPRRRRRR